MANIFQKIGSAFGQYGMDNRMPADQFLNLPKGDRRQMQVEGLQKFCEAMNLIGAQQSGDTQRMALIQNQIRQRQVDEENERQKKAIEAFIQTPEGAPYKDMYTLAGSKGVIAMLGRGNNKRTTIKGADGYNYFVDSGERVLPNVVQEKNQSDRRYEKAADGFYRYVDDGTKVFGGVEVPEQGFEITTKDILGTQKDERKTFEAANRGVKNFQQLLDAAQSADGAASYALMIKFIKQLDDSVVREGEVSTFGNFQGALENFKMYVNKSKGKGFTPRVKANMINLASQTANRLVEDYNNYRSGKEVSYSVIGFDPNMVFAGLDFNLGDLDLTREYTPNDFEIIEYE